MKRRREKTQNGNTRRKHRSGRKVFPQFVGRVQMTREGFIFVIVDGQDADVFVKASKTRHALDGDTVRVAVTRQGGGDRRREGEVVEIVSRSNRRFVGFFHTVGAQAWVLMQSKSMPYDIEVDAEEAAAAGAAPGMKVAAVVDRWDKGEINPFGHLVDVLGEPGANDTEMHAILAEYNLPYRFEKEVEDAADAISDEITASDLKGREDFRGTFTFTIDPADAKDFDDALSYRPLEGGNFEVGVHIADVSWYVHPGDAVDKEARTRGTSVYLVDRTVPMLPEKLCNKLCSLRPGEDKLCFSVIFEMTPKAEIRSRRIARTVIRSDVRLDYDQAQNIISGTGGGAAPSGERLAPLDPIHCPGGQRIPPSYDAEGGTVPGGSRPSAVTEDTASLDPIHCPGGQRIPPSYDAEGGTVPGGSRPGGSAVELTEAVTKLNSVAAILREKRFAAGAINFDRPEMKVEVDSEGRPVNVYQKFSVEANWLIEEFMLLANRTVAEYVASDGKMNAVQSRNAKTFVYRVHGEPNYEKLQSLSGFASGFGYKMGDSSNGKSAAESLRKLLADAKGRPEFAAFENIALRSMAKAVYSTDNIGHYGLAFNFYTHFTSPIRRYPDLMVHRLLAAYLSGGDSRSKDKFDDECKYASERELVAADAERTSIKYKLVEFMQDKLGQEFDGTVSGITEWGMYVEIDPTRIEGMISLREIRSDFYDFDEVHYRLVGRRTGKVFHLGDRVRIRVKSANLEQRLLDYELVEDQK